MAYTEKARALRRCTGTRKDGQPCRSWAVWDDPRQLCAQHAGRGKRGPQRDWLRRAMEGDAWRPARNPNCHCVAYNWPHKPGGGLCRWPDPPEFRLTTPASTHFYRGRAADAIHFMSVRRGQRIR